MQTDLFNTVSDSGAIFSDCRKYRYALWRIWDADKPLIMFIGLNPSTANETETDATISRVKGISDYNGFGGFYMTNCFAYISTDPKQLNAYHSAHNENWLKEISLKCQEVVFAWGNFKVVRELKVDNILRNIFPNAKALYINKNGSPKHPLFCKKKTKLINFK